MRGGGRAELVSLPLRGRGGVGVGFQSVGSDVQTLPRRNPSPPKPSGPAQRAGRSFGPRGSAAQADRPHPLEGEGFKASVVGSTHALESPHETLVRKNPRPPRRRGAVPAQSAGRRADRPADRPRLRRPLVPRPAPESL